MSKSLNLARLRAKHNLRVTKLGRTPEGNGWCEVTPAIDRSVYHLRIPKVKGSCFKKESTKSTIKITISCN